VTTSTEPALTGPVTPPRDLVSLPFADTLARFGQRCFGVALILFGTAAFVVKDVVIGRAPTWPAGVAGAPAAAYFTFVLLAGAGIAVLLNRKPVPWLAAVAALIFGWAFLRQLPIALADHALGGAWTNLGKALALSCGALGVAASTVWTRASGGETARRRAPAMNLTGRIGLGLFLTLSGVQHFMFAQFVKTLVPTWIPGAIYWTYFAGVALMAGGIGLVVPRTARLAALLVGGMIFTWVFVLHIPRGLTIDNQNEWTAVIEALAFSAIAFSLVARPTRSPAA
jgi:uncharacterized membrane protein